MVVGEIPEAVDLLVVGGGPGGYVAALAAAQAGRRVVLIEARGSNGLGGSCLHVGCIPSKALIELSERVEETAAWQTRGAPVIRSGKPNLEAFQVWKRQLTTGLGHGVADLLRHAGVEVRSGHFRFTRPNQGALATGSDTPPVHLQFASCVIATGSRPATLPSLPFDGVRIIDSAGALDLDALPDSLAVVGGGYIGVELGTAFAKLGTAVTIVEAESRLLSNLPASANAAVTERLSRLGVHIYTSTRATHDDGRILHLHGASGSLEVPVDKVVVAVGRVPNTDDLGLEVLGVQTDTRGRLNPGSDRRITPTVAAIGDVTPGPALAHKATAEAHVAVDALGGRPAAFEPYAIPQVVFSDPEVAQAGLSVADATATGLVLSTASFPVSASGRARTLGQTTGSFEWTVDQDGIVRGALIIGPRASELIAEAVACIELGAHLEDIAGMVHAHPTLSELSGEAAMVALNRPIHVPRARRRNRRNREAEESE